MARLVAFLRAVNVGGRRVTNDMLVEVIAGAGFADVSAFQASGNVLLDAGDTSPTAAASVIETALERGLGWRAEVFPRTPGQLDTVLGARPFDDAAVASAPGAVQVILLTGTPDASAVDAVSALATSTDLLQPLGDALLWLPLDGVGRSVLDMKAISRHVGPTTVRGMPTLERIRARLG